MRAYQHALGKVLDGAMTMQAIDKQRNLDRFLARQQRVKKPHSDAQTAQECRTTATALAAEMGRAIEQEANHV